MDKIKFNVSSKTARLIGRENISDSNGAIIELIKNAYDADADTVIVDFSIPFENVPYELSFDEIKKYINISEKEIILSCYNQGERALIKKDNLSETNEGLLKKIFFNKNRIIIFDNGSGMNEEIMKTVWMNIGTDDKEVRAESAKGRLKTGAKGIGRFALEKLSNKTIVYSKMKNDKIVHWELDWSQFESEKLLDDIKAEIEVLDSNFEEIIKKYTSIELLKKNNTDISSGTLIILEGTRENWNDKIFSRINNNLKSINPFGNVDTFNVYVHNLNKPHLNYEPQDIKLSSDDYDYIVKAEYDGNKKVNISLIRNEVDISAKTEKIIDKGEEVTLNIDDFWKREAFKNYPYMRDDYNKTIENQYEVLDLLENEKLEDIKKIGKFKLEFYFLKVGKSEYNFIKDIKVNSRKKLLESFSGIKIYRDNFKIRPYGEDGPMYDWLELGRRVQLSPAGVSHPSGSWRVATYQLIGNVKISRIDNPNLKDMANREGLSLSETYYLFVELIQKIISKFEYDRQYVYREYGLWLKENEVSETRTKEIEEKVLLEKENKKNIEENYTSEDYKDAIYNLSNKNKTNNDVLRVLKSFSSVGITANTFAHEMNSISTNLSTRYDQLSICIKSLLNNQEYEGPDYLNPFIEIESMRSIDDLMSKWLKLIIDSTNKKNSIKALINLSKFMSEITNDWKKLLDKKSINVEISISDDILMEIEKTDLYMIFNNLFLNSAYFLEKETNGKKRIISISSEIIDKNIVIFFKNNGPKLDKKYSNNPDIIFSAGESSKENGTGLGLWICRDAVERNNGQIHVEPCESGFTIKIVMPRV